MKDGRRLSALDVQWIYLENASRYIEVFGADNLGGIELVNDLLSRWEYILGTLKTNPEALSNEIDWIAKRRLYEGFRERHQLRWNDPKLAALDLQYHDLRPDKCLARRMGLTTLVSESEVTNAISNPPLTTRAYFRGRCLQEFPDQVVAANWDSMVFDTGSEALRRVPTLEPLRGTANHVAKLLDECEDAGELLRRLGN
jgi:proteasome accessory factor A